MNPFINRPNTKNTNANCLIVVSPQQSSFSSPPKMSPQVPCLLCKLALPTFHPIWFKADYYPYHAKYLIFVEISWYWFLDFSLFPYLSLYYLRVWFCGVSQPEILWAIFLCSLASIFACLNVYFLPPFFNARPPLSLGIIKFHLGLLAQMCVRPKFGWCHSLSGISGA